MIQAILTDALGNGPRVTANVEIKPDKIALAIGNRVVAWLETKEGRPRLVVFADASRDDATDVIELTPG